MNKCVLELQCDQMVSERWLELIGELAAPFFLCDREGYIRYSNQYLSQLTGYNQSQLQRHPLWQLLTPIAERHEQIAVIAQVFDGERPCHRYDGAWLTAKNQRQIVQWNYHLWVSAEGERLVAALGQVAMGEVESTCVLNCHRVQSYAASQRTLKALQTLAASTNSASNNAFYELCVEQLATLYHTRYVVIARLEDPTQRLLSTLALWDGDHLVPNFSDFIGCTPCQTVLSGETVLIAEGIQALYADHLTLRMMKVESYFGVPLLDEQRQVVGLVALLDDKPLASDAATESLLPIFAQRIAQEMIQQHQNALIKRHQARLQLLVDNTADVLWECDTQGRLRYLSPRCEMVFHRRAADLYNQPFWTPLSASAIAEVRLWFSQGGPLRDMEVTTDDPSGRRHYLELSAVALGDELGGGYLGVYRDISERRWREAERLQRSKLETLGQLTSSIAHDLNNLLTVIQGSLELLDWDSKQDHELLTDALSASRNGSQLIRQLLGFARQQPLEVQLLDLPQFFESFLGFTRHMVRSPARLVTAIDRVLPLVRVDRSALEGALMNLVVNARHAIAPNGEIRLAVTEVTLTKKTGHCAAGDYVRFTVSDNGCGMDATTLAQACEPFFTTKPAGQGTGLGLSSAAQFFRQSQGDLMLTSELGVGTTVTGYLPVVARPTAHAAVAGNQALLGGNETLLLAVEQEELRHFLENALEKLGYTVVLAKNPLLAQAQVAAMPQIQGLLCDLSSQDGDQRHRVQQCLRQQHPQLRAIFIENGATLPPLTLPLATYGYLYKPFSLSELAVKLRQVLTTPSP